MNYRFGELVTAKSGSEVGFSTNDKVTVKVGFSLVWWPFIECRQPSGPRAFYIGGTVDYNILLSM